MIERPTKEDYERFMGTFIREISCRHPDVCFFNFGTYNLEGFIVGRSDIDGGLILDSGIVTPNEKILDIADILAEALKQDRVDTQFNLLDRETCLDGRFLSYTTDYTDWIKDEAIVFSGPNFLNDMNGRNYKAGPLYSSAFNFSGPGGVRKTALYSRDLFNLNNEYSILKIMTAVEKVAKLPKKLLWLRGNPVFQSRMESRKRLQEMFPDLDLTYLDFLNKLLDDPKKFDGELTDQEGSIAILMKSLNLMERMIGSYIRTFPDPISRELRD